MSRRNSELTGIFVRVKRDDKWQPLDITDLTPTEIDCFFEHNTNSVAFLKALISWIQENVNVKPYGGNYDSNLGG